MSWHELLLLGPAHTTPRGVGLMAWAIRRSVFSNHAIWPNYLNTLRLMAWKHAIWPDYLNTLRLMAWKHAIWPTFLYHVLYIVHRPARERELSTDIFPVRER